MSVRKGNDVIAGGIVIQIDNELSSTSANPVQNHVITEALSNINTALGDKQETLVSGTNIKTINGESILGSGDISTGTVDQTYDPTSTNAQSGTAVLQAVSADIDCGIMS